MRFNIFCALIVLVYVDKGIASYSEETSKYFDKSLEPSIDRACTHGHWKEEAPYNDVSENDSKRITTIKTKVLNRLNNTNYNFNLCDSSTTFHSRREQYLMIGLSLGAAASSAALLLRCAHVQF